MEMAISDNGPFQIIKMCVVGVAILVPCVWDHSKQDIASSEAPARYEFPDFLEGWGTTEDYLN